MSASSCTAEINARLATPDAFSAWKGNTATDLNTITTPAGAPRLAQIEADVFSTVGCIQEKINGLNALPTTISKAQEDILKLQEQLLNRKDTIRVAKDRVAYLTEPEYKVSFYESWFPINRPLKPVTIPVLISLATFLTLLSLGFLFALVGIYVFIQFPQLGSPGGPSFFAQLTPAFWGLFAVSLTAILYLIYRKPS